MTGARLDLDAAPPLGVEIYAIIRVYNLGKNDMDLRIYLDPKTWEIRGDLDFSADPYIVIPRH